MTRERKLFFNTITSLGNQIVTLVCGFILPRYFLKAFGSDVNGLVSSITQFLGFITLAELGVGAVVQSTLYKPFAKKDNIAISRIMKSSENFFKKIAMILCAYTIILIIFYPLVVSDDYSYFYTSSLIFVISISLFAQYYFSISYKLLLNADQMSFIQLILQSVTLILNTIVSIFLMNLETSIQFIKLSTSIIFFLQPIFLHFYVKKHYNLDKKITLKEEPIKQKWNGLAQHVASVVLGNTDIVVLTLFSTLGNVSIYSIYFLVVNGIKQLVTAATNGILSFFGSLLANNENEKLIQVFSNTEWLLHTLTTLFFTCSGILIVPFVQVYTIGIKDVNYVLPLFGYLMALAQATYCLRLPYNMMVLAAGHFKETQTSAIIEVIINIVISILLVNKFGLVGVTVGTILAMLYRTIYFAIYLSNNIIKRPFKHFTKHIIIDTVTALLIWESTRRFVMSSISYTSWIMLAIKVVILSLVICLIVNFIFYKKELIHVLKKNK